MKIFNKKWLTFIEVIISTVISVIVFIIIFSFVADSISNLSTSNRKAEVLSKFYDIYEIMWNYRNNFLSWSVVINNSIWSWSDIALIKNINNSDWIIFWIIDKDTLKLESWSLSSTYWYRVFWYKRLSLSELSKIQANSAEVYNLSFKDAITFETPIKSFQADFFNSWSIFVVDLWMLLVYNSAYKWMLWSDISSNNYEVFKINFTF